MAVPLTHGIIVAKLNGHMKAEIEKMAAGVGIMATKATKNNIHIGSNLILVTKANSKELEKRIKLILEEQHIDYVIAYNELAISDTKQETENFTNMMFSRYGLKTLFYKSIY